MNVGQGQAYESYFGPPSDHINITEFLNSRNAESQGEPSSSSLPALLENAKEKWAKLPEEKRNEIETECSVEDLTAQLRDVIGNPRLMAHTTNTHELFVRSVHESADTSNKRKRKRITLTEPAHEHPDIRPLQTNLDKVQLQCWPLTPHSALFIRSPRHSDHNTLSVTKCLAFSPVQDDTNQALIFVTVYNPISWGHRLLGRASQHVLLSSQSLGDLFDAIPCASNEMPEECVDADGRRHWQHLNSRSSAGAVMCIEDAVYGDGQSEKDYSDKLLDHLNALPAKNRPVVSKGSPMHDTAFSSLSLRLRKPHWLLHAGNCEHFFVFEHVRAHHPSDPPISRYPLTTQITPPLLDTCRACGKVPAAYSITGDIRLGETPFVICAHCWRWMGDPRPDQKHRVAVVPLPRFEHGWGG